MKLPVPLTVYAGLVVAGIGFTTNAHATPITYDISGIASGRIGATTFTNASVEVTGTGDTDGVVPIFFNGFMVYANVLSTTTVTIEGVGTAEITDPDQFEIWAIPFPAGDPQLPPRVIIGRVDHPPALDSITGMGFVVSDALTGYDLTTAMGPVVDYGGITFNLSCGGGTNQDPCISTTLGLLSFSSDISPTDQGTFVATLPPVPEG
jgi:hypothetical protein